MSAPMENSLAETLVTFSSITERPEDFVTINTGYADRLSKTLKYLYDTKKTVDTSNKSANTLSELIVEDFDEEQVWQQLELENESLVTALVSSVAKIFADKSHCTFKSQSNTGSVTKFRDSSKLKTEKDKKAKQSVKRIEEDESFQGSDFDEDFGEDLDLKPNSHREGNDTEDSDEEFHRIQTRLGIGEDSIDEDDKFFDFTGDSDEDLKYDLGPLGQTDHLDDGVDKSNEEGNKKSNKKKKKKGKKSVTFKDEVDEGKLFRNEDEDHEMDVDKPSHKTGKSKTLKGLVNKFKKKGSIVDDQFFKLYEMEAFLDQEDRKEEKRNQKEKFDDDDEFESDEDENDEDEVDLFDDIPSKDEGYHYDDFFDDVEGNTGEAVDDPDLENEEMDNIDDNEDEEEEGEDFTGSEFPEASDKEAKDLFGDSDSEGEDAAEILGHKQPEKSTYEVRQEKLKKKISAMEEASIAEKPWQLMGEIQGLSRPENSLLQENLQFELTTRMAPEITEETTLTLEQMIKQRIKDKAWNDVERKVKPKENPTEYKKRITLDQEKSKLSLGEIYEQEYLKQQAKDKADEDEPIHKDHEEIKKMMQSLFVKLDALSNFLYTPKQTMPEVKIVADQPSISMEEVAPISVSAKTILAPEEIQEKEHGELKGDTEKTKTDRQRERRKKKLEKRKKNQEKQSQIKQIEKLNPGLGNKYSKEKALKQLEKESKSEKNNLTMIKGDKDKTNLTSSKAFFTQLQEEVKTSINSRREEKRKKQSDHQANAKKFKL